MISKSFLFVFFLLILLAANSIFGRGAAAFGVGFVYIGYDTALLVFVSLQMLKVLKLEKNKDLEVLGAPRPTLAILIPARNEASVLLNCLRAIEKQIDRPEIVYWIDDGSVDDTRGKLETFSKESKLSVIPIFKAHTGKSDSLNQVWPTVDAEIILTLDADTILEPRAIFEIRNAFAKNINLAVTGGLLTPRSIHAPGGFFENFQRFEYIRSFLARRAWMTKNALLLVSGAFAAYRKKVLFEVGGYDLKSLVEDYDLTHRIHRYSYDHGLHYEVQVTVGARAETDVPGNLKLFLRQRKRWFNGFLQTQFKFGDMVGNRKYGTVGRFMLVIKSADTLQPIYGLFTLATLVYFTLSKRMISDLVWEALLAKIVIDLLFHYASVAIYYRWRGEKIRAKTWALSTLATFLEPISFQIFRHTGAFLGWLDFLARRQDWAPQREHIVQE